MRIDGLILTFLLNALWQVPVAVAAALLGDRLLRRSPARYRHALWLGALAAAVLLPASSLLPQRTPVPEIIPSPVPRDEIRAEKGWTTPAGSGTILVLLLGTPSPGAPRRAPCSIQVVPGRQCE